MKVTFINKSDSLGGAAVVTLRLVQALRRQGVDARMLVSDCTLGRPYVAPAGEAWRMRYAFLQDRLPLLLHNGFSRRTLFQIDAARAGMPLWRHPWVIDADVVAPAWINQGVLSLQGLRRIAALGKPIVWTTHDMWCMTGVCHHAYACRGYEGGCGRCPLLGRAAAKDDLSAKVLRRKRELYADADIHFVAVSNWLAAKGRESLLLGGAHVEVIPNAFPSTPLDEVPGVPAKPTGSILMVAARLDDPIKGLPLLVLASQALRRLDPQLSENLHFDLVGELRQPDLLRQMALPYTLHGRIDDASRLRELYRDASAVVSASLFETLPGTLIEAQDMGRMPVAFDSGGQSDIIEHGRTGWLARRDENPAVAAENLARGLLWAVQTGTDSNMAAALHASVVRKFDAAEVAKRYIQLFEKLIDK